MTNLRSLLTLVAHPKRLWRLFADLILVATSGYYDHSYYLANSPDLRGLQRLPVWHFVRRGGAERRSPSARFNTSYYMALYRDVALSGMNPLVHFVRYGCREGRWPAPFFPACEKIGVGGHQDLPRQGPIRSCAVIVSGGSPALHERVLIAVRRLREQRVDVVVVATNEATAFFSLAPDLNVHLCSPTDVGVLLELPSQVRTDVFRQDLVLRLPLSALEAYGAGIAEGVIDELLHFTGGGTLAAFEAFASDQKLGVLLPHCCVRQAQHALTGVRQAVAQWLELNFEMIGRLNPCIDVYWCSTAVFAPFVSADLQELRRSALHRFNEAEVSAAIESQVVTVAQRCGYSWRECDFGRQALSLVPAAAVGPHFASLRAIDAVGSYFYSSPSGTDASRRVLAVLLNYNCTDDVVAAACSLKEQNVPLDIVVIDNYSSLDERAKLESLSRSAEGLRGVEVVWADRNLGFAGGNNIGLQRGLDQGYEYLLVMNPDARLQPNGLSAMLRYFSGHSDIGAVSPVIYKDRDRSVLWYAGAELDPLTGVPRHIGLGDKRVEKLDLSARSIEVMTGCCMLFSARCLEQVGLIPEDHFLYFEDTDWSMMARNQGWRIVLAPDAEVVHFQTSSGSSAELPKSHYLYYFLRNRIRFVRKWNSGKFNFFLAHHHEFVEAYRNKVKSIDSTKLPLFEQIVSLAVSDGIANRGGPRDISHLRLG